MTAKSLLELDRVLSRIEELVALGKSRFDTDDLVRLSIERLWIYAGNLALAFCDDENIADGVESLVGDNRPTKRLRALPSRSNQSGEGLG